MKAIASVALAATIAATSLTTTTSAAFAGGNQWNKHQQYNQQQYKQQQYKHHGKRYHGNNNSNGWNPGAALATGAILGLAFGALTAPTYYYPPPVYAYPPPPPPPPVYPTYYSGYQGQPQAQHVSWCSSKYRSYNARYNTWIGYDGYTHQCVSPF